MRRPSPTVCGRPQSLLLLAVALLSLVSLPPLVFASVCQAPPCTSSTCIDQTKPGLVQLPVATVYDLVSPPGSPDASNAVDGSLYSCWTNIAVDNTGTVYPHFDFSGDGALTYWVAGFSLFNYNQPTLLRVSNGSVINSEVEVATYTMPLATSQSSTYYVLPNPLVTSGLTVAQWPGAAQCEALFFGVAALPISQVVDPLGFATEPVALNNGGPVSSIIDGVGTRSATDTSHTSLMAAHPPVHPTDSSPVSSLCHLSAPACCALCALCALCAMCQLLASDQRPQHQRVLHAADAQPQPRLAVLRHRLQAAPAVRRRTRATDGVADPRRSVEHGRCGAVVECGRLQRRGLRAQHQQRLHHLHAQLATHRAVQRRGDHRLPDVSTPRTHTHAHTHTHTHTHAHTLAHTHSHTTHTLAHTH